MKTRKIGGSIAIRIPKEIVEEENIGEGDFVAVDVRRAKRDWFGAFPKPRPFSREEELAVWEPTGR